MNKNKFPSTRKYSSPATKHPSPFLFPMRGKRKGEGWFVACGGKGKGKGGSWHAGKRKGEGWFVAGFEPETLGLACQPLTHNANLGP